MIEDDHALRATMQLAIERLGYRFAGAGSVSEAVDFADETDIDVVILDMHLPGPSRFDAIEAIIGLLPRVPIIAMSGLHLNDAELTAVLQGAEAFIEKPFTAQQLISVIQRVVPLK